MPARVYLASRQLPGLGEFLAGCRRAAFVPTAANPLADRRLVVDELIEALQQAGVPFVDADVDLHAPAEIAARLRSVDAIVVGGGDPYHLLARLRASGAAEVVRAQVAAGTRYVGVSAGAMVAGPSLEPQAQVSPFPPPPGLDLSGLALTDLVIFPHRNLAGRAARIAAAEQRFSAHFRLRALADDEVCVADSPPDTLLVSP
jgi:dipeptidase E